VPRAVRPQISFADWELLQQGISLEPLLQTISDFLEDHEEMIEAVRRDLERGLKNSETGRKGLTPSQVLRSFLYSYCANSTITYLIFIHFFRY
jgi:IS5 family transposase